MGSLQTGGAKYTWDRLKSMIFNQYPAISQKQVQHLSNIVTRNAIFRTVVQQLTRLQLTYRLVARSLCDSLPPGTAVDQAYLITLSAIKRSQHIFVCSSVKNQQILMRFSLLDFKNKKASIR